MTRTSSSGMSASKLASTEPRTVASAAASAAALASSSASLGATGTSGPPACFSNHSSSPMSCGARLQAQLEQRHHTKKKLELLLTPAGGKAGQGAQRYVERQGNQ